MTTAKLMVKEPSSRRWKGIGVHEFKSLPRVGEHIEIERDSDKQAYLYRVVAVHHPGVPAASDADIMAVQVGRTADVLLRLFEAS